MIWDYYNNYVQISVYITCRALQIIIKTFWYHFLVKQITTPFYYPIIKSLARLIVLDP